MAEDEAGDVRQTNVRLKPETRDEIDRLAVTLRLSKTRVIETAIRKLAESEEVARLRERMDRAEERLDRLEAERLPPQEE